MPTEPQITAGGGAPNRGPSLSAINGLRGPGAIAIAAAHLSFVADVIPAARVFPLALLVDLFFVLSGLVIAQAYAARLAKPSEIPEYIVRRFGRIWPVQAATLALLVGFELFKLALVAIGHGHFSSQPFSDAGLAVVAAIPTNLLLIHALGFHGHETWNYPSWSLSVEFVTYVAFALVCLLSPRLRHAFSAAIVIASTAILVLVAPFGMRSTFDFGIFRCLAGFFAGTLCLEVAKRWPLPRPSHPTLAEVAVVALVGIWLFEATGTWAVFAAPLVFAALVLSFLGEGGAIARLLRTDVMQRLADLSFSIYMVHAIVLIALVSAAHAFARIEHLDLFRMVPDPLAAEHGITAHVEVLHIGSVAAAVTLVVTFAIGVAIATYAAHRFVEIPGRALFNGLAKKLSLFVARGQARAKAAAMEPSP